MSAATIARMVRSSGVTISRPPSRTNTFFPRNPSVVGRTMAHAAERDAVRGVGFFVGAAKGPVRDVEEQRAEDVDHALDRT
jgi:hypothetical protein